MLKYSTGERLKQIMSKRNLKQVDIVKMCEPLCKQFKVRLGKNDLSQYISGKVEPRQNKLYILASALNVSEAWLMGYDVPQGRADSNMTKDSQEALILYEQLDTEDKAEIRGEMKQMLKADKYKKENILYTAPSRKIAAHGADGTKQTKPPRPRKIT